MIKTITAFSGKVGLLIARKFRLLTVCWIVFVISGLAVNALLLPDRYRATAMVVSTSAETKNSLGSAVSQISSIGGIAGIAEARDPLTEEAIGVLKGRSFCSEFLKKDDRSLVVDRLGIFSFLRAHALASDEVERSRCTKFRVSVLDVSKDRKTGIFSISAMLPSPAVAAEWANQFVSELNAEMSSRSIASSNRIIAELQRELASESGVETSNAIAKALEIEVKKRALAAATPDYVFRFVDRAYVPGPESKASPTQLVRALLIGLLGLAGYLTLVRVRRRYDAAR